MPVRMVYWPTDSPKPVWTVGGVQLIADPDFTGPEACLGHLDVMMENIEVALEAAHSREGVKAMPRGRSWLALPYGLCVEMMQATGNAVACALAVNLRG
jgi:hypothetical protein